MDTPSSLFTDCLGIDGGDHNARSLDVAPRAATLDESFPMFADRMLSREAPFPSTSKTNMSDLGTWDGTEEATGIGEADMLQQRMFVPRAQYAEVDGDTMMALLDRASKTPSRTPELIPSTRPTSSLKSRSSHKSEQSTSSSSTSLSAGTAITPPDPEPPKKRTRTTKIKKEPQEDDKRNKFLERNRIAASKCREKKKQFVSELEETKVVLEGRNAHLQGEYNALVTEVGSLKHQLMMHAKCNDPNIDKWISNEAAKFVQTRDLFSHRRGAAGGGGQTVDPAAHTRHSSVSSINHDPAHGISFSSAGRRESLAYSQGTSLDYAADDSLSTDLAWIASSSQTSPTDMVFPSMTSPTLAQESTLNFDHMPDDMFDTEQ